MSKRASKKALLATGTMLSLASCLAYAFCPPQYQEQMVQPVITAATAQIQSAIAAMDASLSGVLLTQSQRLSSAVAVLTKQKAISANQMAQASVNANQMLAEGMKTISQTERVKKARFDFGGEFGQGYNPCLIMAQRNLIASRNADISSELNKRVRSEIDSGPGKYASLVEARNSFVERHKKYCTPDEVSSGMCNTEGDLPGADTSLATLFNPVMEGSAEYDAKNAYINNLAGMPDQPIPSSSAKSVSAQSYMLNKNRRDAMISPALAALKNIQLDTSGIEGAETGKELPMSQLMENEVKRYSGNSDAYTAWSRALVSQNERGVMIEILKVKALDLAQKARLYKQYETMESLLAGMTAMQAQNLSQEAAVGTQRAANTSTKAAIQ